MKKMATQGLADPNTATLEGLTTPRPPPTVRGLEAGGMHLPGPREALRAGQRPVRPGRHPGGRPPGCVVSGGGGHSFSGFFYF